MLDYVVDQNDLKIPWNKNDNNKIGTLIQAKFGSIYSLFETLDFYIWVRHDRSRLS